MDKEKESMTAVPMTEQRSIADEIKAKPWKGILVLIVALAPVISAFTVGRTVWITIAIEILVFAIAAMSYDLMFGYTGMLSFGHALFFGGGAYVVAILSSEFGLTYLQALPAVLILLPILGVTIGALSLRLTGVYFAIITLAFGQLGYQMILQFSDITRGVTGIAAITIPSIAGFSLTNTYVSYYILLTAFLLVYVLLRRIVQSPFGRVLQGIRENEERIQMLGIYTYKFKLFSFTIAAVIGGVAGALYPLFFSFVHPGLINWTTTGDILLITLVGGIGTLWGSILGAAFFIGVKEVLVNVTEQWRIILGLTFVFFVLFLPSGIAGFIKGDRIHIFDNIKDQESGSISPLSAIKNTIGTETNRKENPDSNISSDKDDET